VALALRRIRTGVPLALTGALVCAAALGGPPWRGHGRPLRITLLSVGQGDSAVLELPQGAVLLLDGGGSVVGSFDPGREVLVPFLWDRGISRLRAVILSHPHPDHANGLPYVMARLPTEEFWSTGEPCPLAACEELEHEIGLQRVTRRLFTRAAHELTLDGVHIEALYPLAPEGYYPELRENDNSLVLKLSYGSFSALLPGDVEAEAEARLLADPTADLAAQLLKAPHHGSDTSSTPEFVRRVAPQAVVFSVGPRNRFDFPREEVVERYRALGARLYRTDRDGAITFETDGETWNATTSAPRQAN
jgi:competence protein ComEC